jgi:hypothetical protein
MCLQNFRESVVHDAFDSLGAPLRAALIYKLIGCALGKQSVIEWTENGFETREHKTSVSNDWVPSCQMWEPHIAASHFLTCSSVEAAVCCRTRLDASVDRGGLLSCGRFDLVKPPVLIPYTWLI